MERFRDIYKINYEKIPYGSKVVIYGAGHVGETYVESIKRTGRLYIVAVLDRNRVAETCGGMIVRKPEDILLLSYDFILIAMEDSTNVHSVRNSLVEKGIPNEKIVWNGNEDSNILRSNQEYEKFLERNLQRSKKRIFLFMVPEHGNVGDYAIAYAEISFLKHYFPMYEVITVTTLEWMNAKNAIIGFVGKSDLIFLNGGGYLGDLWEGDTENYKSIVENFKNHKIIFFPNTLSYKEEIAGNAVFADEMNWFARQRHVFVMFRDSASFEAFHKFSPNSMLAPDMALYFGTVNGKCGVEHEKKNGVLVCLRHDREKLIDSENLIAEQLKDRDIKYSELEINAERYISFSQGGQYIQKICGEMKKSDCVITDRLHGMFLAVISNVPCVALDNRTHKVKGCLEWIKDKGYVVYCDDIQNIDMCGMVKEAISRKRNAGEFVFSKEEFDRMAKSIKMFIQ